MNLIVIRGGLGCPADATTDVSFTVLSPADVRAEARRRITASGYHVFRARHLATGVPMPASIRYAHLQINFAAEAIARLKPIPADYQADRYWPG